MRQIVKSIVLVGIISGLLSCTTVVQQPANKEPIKPPTKIVKLMNGIPIYPGFSYQESKSFVYESGQVRAGVLVFSGKATMSQLVDFYKSKMPDYGWNLVSFFQHDQDSFLNYDAPDRTCQLTLHVGDFSSTITIRTGTKVVQDKTSDVQTVTTPHNGASHPH